MYMDKYFGKVQRSIRDEALDALLLKYDPTIKFGNLDSQKYGVKPQQLKYCPYKKGKEEIQNGYYKCICLQTSGQDCQPLTAQFQYDMCEQNGDSFCITGKPDSWATG